MITATLIDVLGFFLGALLDALPQTDVPPWLADAGSYIPTVFSFANSMGVWFPWGVLNMILPGVVAVWLAAFGIRICRIVISHFTGGGGAT